MAEPAWRRYVAFTCVILENANFPGAEEAPIKDKAYRRYAAGVEKTLALFETALEEWADYISFLNKLLKVCVEPAARRFRCANQNVVPPSPPDLVHFNPQQSTSRETTLAVPQSYAPVWRPPKGPRGIHLHLHDYRQRWIVTRPSPLSTRTCADPVLRVAFRSLAVSRPIGRIFSRNRSTISPSRHEVYNPRVAAGFGRRDQRRL